MFFKYLLAIQQNKIKYDLFFSPNRHPVEALVMYQEEKNIFLFPHLSQILHSSITFKAA